MGGRAAGRAVTVTPPPGEVQTRVKECLPELHRNQNGSDQHYMYITRIDYMYSLILRAMYEQSYLFS